MKEIQNQNYSLNNNLK